MSSSTGDDSRQSKVAVFFSLSVLLLAGTGLLFFAISKTTIDGSPMPPYVFYSLLNFVIFSIPTTVFLYYIYVALYSYTFLALSGSFIAYWDFDVLRQYVADDFRCTYWHQGDFLCGAFANMLFMLIGAALCLLIGIFVQETFFREQTEANIGYTKKAISAALVLLLILDFFAIAIN